MIKVAAIAISIIFLGVLLRKIKPEYSLCVVLCGTALIFVLGIEKIKTILEMIEKIRKLAGIDIKYIKILVKVLGIAYIAEFSSSLCRDAGQTAVAGQIDFFGKVSMLVISMPILFSLLEMVGELT